jgi:glutamate dehydrogenase
VLAATDTGLPALDRVAAWEAADSITVDRATVTLKEILADDNPDLARLSVGLRVVRSMVATRTG